MCGQMISKVRRYLLEGISLEGVSIFDRNRANFMDQKLSAEIRCDQGFTRQSRSAGRQPEDYKNYCGPRTERFVIPWK